MGNFQIIHRITLSDEQDADAFETFMRDEYLPAVHKGPTRVGQVTSVTLLRGVADTHQRMPTFLMNVGYDGMATGRVNVDDQAVRDKFESFGAQIERVGAFTQVAVWDEESDV